MKSYAIYDRHLPSEANPSWTYEISQVIFYMIMESPQIGILVCLKPFPLTKRRNWELIFYMQTNNFPLPIPFLISLFLYFPSLLKGVPDKTVGKQNRTSDKLKHNHKYAAMEIPKQAYLIQTISTCWKQQNF